MSNLQIAYTQLKADMDEAMKTMIEQTVGDVTDVFALDDEDYAGIKMTLKMYESAMAFADLALKQYEEDEKTLKEILEIVKRLEK